MDVIADTPARDEDKTRPTRAEAEAAVKTLIAWAGDNPAREGLLETPSRVAKAYGELFSGYNGDPQLVLDRVFEDVAGYDDLVLVKDIPFHSHCEHHMLPFFGTVHVAYYPANGVVGLSKIARLVDIYARRLQTQETMTAQIAAAMEDALGARGVAVMIEAEHLCMSMRGIAKAGALTVTTRFSGLLRDDTAAQARFLSMVRG